MPIQKGYNRVSSALICVDATIEFKSAKNFSLHH